jgi:hypothetical protein
MAGRPPRAESAAQATLTLRLTQEERDIIDQLVELRAKEIGDDAEVSAGSYIRSLIRREARDKGILSEDKPAPAAKKTVSRTKRT